MSTRIHLSFDESNQQSTIGIEITTPSESIRESTYIYIYINIYYSLSHTINKKTQLRIDYCSFYVMIDDFV